MSSILSGTAPAGAMKDSSKIMLNFVKMSICFSLNHGAVTAMLALAVPLLGKENGPISTGTLYVAYALTALLLSAPIMGCLGTRKGLIVGCWVYCGYVASFPLALTVDTDADPHNPFVVAVAVAGGVIGGFAAGFLWNAQGAYFAASTKLYAAAAGVSQESATGTFAAVFASIFLSLEVVLKLLASAIKLLNGASAPAAGTNGTNVTHGGAWALASGAGNGSTVNGNNGTASSTGNTVVSIVYSLIAVVASLIMVMVWDLDKTVPESEMPFAAEDGKGVGVPLAEEVAKQAPKVGALTKVLAAMRLWVDRPTVLLLNLIQVAFGVSATLLYIQVSGRVVKATFGKQDSVTVVGFMAATTALVAALCQVPFAKMSSTRLGKPPFMVLSLSAFVVLGVLVAALPTETLGHWPVLVLLYVLQGIGRAGYEGANKAIYADFFPDDSVAAFGNVILFNGLAGAASSYIFPHITTTAQSVTSVACGGLAIVGYLAAEVIHRQQKRSSDGYAQTQ